MMPTLKMRTVRQVLILVLALCLPTQLPLANGDPPVSPEYLIKAAFIYNFAMFVEWPNYAFLNDSSPIVIGILGADPFGSALDRTVRDKRVNGRRFTIKKVYPGDDLRSCHIVFVSSAEKGKTLESLTNLKGLPILTVGESPGFAKGVGIVNFLIEEGRVRCEINAEAAKAAHLNISSKLLSISKITS